MMNDLHSSFVSGFLLPAFHRLLNQGWDRKRGYPAILVLAPTRELGLLLFLLVLFNSFMLRCMHVVCMLL